MLIAFIKGLLIGLAIAAPVGPIGILCINRSLRFGFMAGFVSGLGAATADGIYAVIAGLGLVFIINLLIHYQFWIELIGGLFLLYLGIKLIVTKVTDTNVEVSNGNIFSYYISTLFLTLTNPLTILSFIAIFAGLGVMHQHTDYAATVSLIIGVLLGSLLWWLILSSVVAFILHKKLSANIRKRLNDISGIIIFLFGLLALIKLF